MYVVHFKRRNAILTLAGVVLAAVLALVLAGCFGGKQAESVTLADDAARVEYLTQLGWQAGFPFADYAGQAVRRYTYAVGNYPGVPEGVQANLYLCGGTLIGGDIIATGKGGFQRELTFPKS